MHFFKNSNYSKKLVKSLEIVPTHLNTVKNQLNELKNIADHLDFLTVTDNARGKATINSIVYADILKKELNVSVVPHITTRDRNALSLKSDIYAGLLLNLDGFFVVGGDHIENHKEVREVDTLRLISMIRETMNEYSINDSKIGSAISCDYERDYVLKKLSSGTDFFITQGLFQIHQNMHSFINEFGEKIIGGFIIPKSKSFLENFKNMGLNMPEYTLNRLLNSENLEEESIKLILEIYEEIKSQILGIHIMPINNFKAVQNLLEVL